MTPSDAEDIIKIGVVALCWRAADWYLEGFYDECYIYSSCDRKIRFGI